MPTPAEVQLQRCAQVHPGTATAQTKAAQGSKQSRTVGGRPRDEEALLGTDRDSAAARKLKRGFRSVAHRRALLGVPAFKHQWTEAEERLLGTGIDHVIAQKLGRTAVSVAHRRRHLGLPPAAVPGARHRSARRPGRHESLKAKV